MITLPERQLVVTLLSDAKLAGARQQTACAVLGLSVRTIQRWQAGGEVSPDQRLTRCVEPANKLSQAERSAILARANSAELAICRPAKSCHGCLIAANILRLPKRVQGNRRSTACCGRISCIAGILLTYRPVLAGCSFICICLWIYLAAKSSAGKSMRKKAATWPAI